MKKYSLQSKNKNTLKTCDIPVIFQS